MVADSARKLAEKPGQRGRDRGHISTPARSPGWPEIERQAGGVFNLPGLLANIESFTAQDGRHRGSRPGWRDIPSSSLTESQLAHP